MTKTSTNNGKKAVKDALHNHEATTSYAKAVAPDQTYDDIKDRLKKLEREATHSDQSHMSKEISELRTNTQTFNKRINDIDANVKTARREHETNLQALLSAIQSTKELGENFNKTTARLEANMTQIAKQEVDILRKDHETIFTNQRLEYNGTFNHHDQRIARLESLLKYVSPSQPQPLQSSIAHNPNAQHFNPNKQATQSNYSTQASSTPTSTVVHEAHNVIYRNNTPAPMYPYPAPWNENAGATGQLQHFRQ
jgi:chromosome segregation ATPase